MTDENVVVQEESDDPTLLLVRGQRNSPEEDREHVNRLAGAISRCIAKHGKAKLRSVGATSTYNAIKAATKVFDKFRENGLGLNVNLYRKIVNFSGNEKTAIVIEITEESISNAIKNQEVKNG